jgi:drug/metabolite transporter (DMT)-like permease
MTQADPTPSRQAAGVLAVVATAFLWSSAGLFIKVVDWHPFAIAGSRSLIAAVVILVWLRRPHFHFSFAQVAAAVCNCATMLLFVLANKTTTAANAILIQYVAPVFTAFLGAAMLKERVRPEHWGAMVVVAAGMVVLFMDKLGGGQLFGNLIALCSGLTFSLYFVFMRMQKDGSPLESILMSHLLAALIGLVVSLFMPLPAISLQAVGAIAALGLVQVGVSSVLFAYGIKHVSAVSANLIAVIEPVFNPVWVFLVIREAPSANAVIGGLMIIAAVTVSSVVGARRSARGA